MHSVNQVWLPYHGDSPTDSRGILEHSAVFLKFICTVLQTIGGAAVLSALNSPIKDFVLIGNLTQLPQCREVFSKMDDIYHVHFHIPPYAEYRTAIGAALAYVKERQG